MGFFGILGQVSAGVNVQTSDERRHVHRQVDVLRDVSGAGVASVVVGVVGVVGVVVFGGGGVGGRCVLLLPRRGDDDGRQPRRLATARRRGVAQSPSLARSHR